MKEVWYLYDFYAKINNNDYNFPPSSLEPPPYALRLAPFYPKPIHVMQSTRWYTSCTCVFTMFAPDIIFSVCIMVENAKTRSMKTFINMT